jgi:hypothetical protein
VGGCVKGGLLECAHVPLNRRHARTLGSSLLCLVLGSTALSAQSLTSSAGQGWQPFTLAKPPEPPAIVAGRTDATDPRWRPRLPPRNDVLKSAVGLGYVWQQDWGLELGASGRIAGIQTDLSSFLTIGPAGIEAPAARLSLSDPLAGWGVEAGDLITELRGLARGVRFSWSGGEKHRPTVSIYVPNSRLRDKGTVIAYRDEIRLASRVVAGGELGSDGSYALRTAYVQSRFDVQASHRRVRREDPGEDSALMGSYRVGRGVMIQAGLRWFETATDRGRSRLLAVRIPVSRLFDVTLEDNRTAGRSSNDVSNAVVFQLLRGPVRLTQRYQWGDTEYLQVGGPFGIERRQLQTSGSFSPTRWATLGLQTATQWLEDGRARQWQELHSAFTLSRRAHLQLYTSFPDIVDRSRLRGRFVQELPKQCSLLVDFGRVSAFQSATVLDSKEPRLSVMFRKSWRTPTPARGGQVSGFVLDELGNPVVGAGVRLGPYLAITDERGRYEFSKVPRGEFQLALAGDLLPALYVSDGASRQIVMESSTREVLNLTAIPLNSIRGRVYQDVNQNGRFDRGEGRPRMALHLGDRVTATDADGAYGFYNLQPGQYVVRLDTDRPGELYTATSAPEVTVDLHSGRPALDIDFRIALKEKPVILQKASR